MIYRNLFRYLGALTVLTLLSLLTLGVLHWLDMSAGHFTDWLVGIAGFWWLTLVVTVPWDVHFEARHTLDEAATAAERGIAVSAERVAYVESVARRALAVALVLHGLSALGFYALAAAGISPVGYFGAGMAMLLTALRPAARTYAYLAQQLRTFREETTYPREDVVTLRHQVDHLSAMLDLEADDSWATLRLRFAEETRTALDRLRSDLRILGETNTQEHKRFVGEYRQALAQVTEDRRFLEHVREIVRFVKHA